MLIQKYRFVALAGVMMGAALMLSACQQSPTSPTASGSGGAAGLLAKKGGSKQGKVDVCHLTGNGSYNLINVNGNALSAHLAHGDGQPGDGTFDDACVEVVDPPEPDIFTASVGGGFGNEASGQTVELSCADGTEIEVISGIYGANCDGQVTQTGDPDQTAHLSLWCDESQNCSYLVDAGVIGDPYFGCHKQYVATWACVPVVID